jgi:hypothetical protein
LSITIAYVDCAYRRVNFDFCSLAGMKFVETSNVDENVRVTLSVEKMPDWVGTMPQVTSTTARDAQKTGQ